MMRSKASSVMRRGGPSPPPPMPTLFCRKSIRPQASTQAEANARQSAALVQSPATHSKEPPSSAISLPVSRAESMSRSASSTRAPSRANRSAAARPVPTVSPGDCPAPTTIPTFPSSLIAGVSL